MELLKKAICVLVCCSILAYAQGNTFTKVRYNGGSVSTTVKPDVIRCRNLEASLAHLAEQPV